MTSLYICLELNDQSQFGLLFRALRAAHYELHFSPDGNMDNPKWRKEMKAQVRACDQVVLILSQHTQQSVFLPEIATYAAKLGHRLAYYDGGISNTSEQLATWGLSPDTLTRVRLDKPDSLGIRGLLHSRGRKLSHNRYNNPDKSQKSKWLDYVLHTIGERLPGGIFPQTEFLRRANQYLEPYNQYRTQQMHNLFDYRRGTPFPIVQLIAYIRVFREWLPDFSQEEAIKFLRLSGIEESDLSSDWMLRKLRTIFPVHARVNPTFPTMAAPFYGRDVELDNLHDSLMGLENKIVLLEGMPGIGKTELAKAVVLEHQEQFDLIFWHEMRTPVSSEAFIRQFISFADPVYDNTPGHHALIELLQTYHCLIVFDQFEAVLDRSIHNQDYLPNYSDYHHLLRDIATAQGSSVLLITATHLPQQFNNDLAVRYHETVERYSVKGLDWKYTRKLLDTYHLDAPDSELKQLTNHFGGHPSAIKSAILKITDGHYSSVSDYLTHALRDGDHIKATVNELEQGSPSGVEALYWLAIEREYTTLDRLRHLMRESRNTVLEAMQWLTSTYLAEQHPADLNTYRIRSDALDYITQQLIDRTIHAVLDEDIPLLLKYGLNLAGSWDHIYNAQVELLLKPIVNGLVEKVGQPHTVRLLKKLVIRLQTDEWRGIRGYAAANIINLLLTMGVSLDGMNLSQLCLYEVDLRSIPLIHVDFSEVHFSDCLFDENFASPLCMDFDTTRKWLVIGTTDGRIHLWDSLTCVEMWATSTNHVWVHSVSFSQDGSIVISGDSHGMIRLWDASDGHLLAQYTGQIDNQRLYSLAVGTGNRLASGGGDGMIRLWQIVDSSLTPLWEYGPFYENKPEWSRLYCVAFHPNGNLVAVAGEQNSIYLLDADDGHILNKLDGHSNSVWGLAFSPDGNYLGSASEDKTVRVWDMGTRTCLKIFTEHTNTPLGIAFSQDSKLLASGGIDKNIYVRDVETGTLVKRLSGHRRWVRDVIFQPRQIVNGSMDYLVSVGDDRAIKYWDTELGETVQSWEGIQLSAQALAVSQDASLMATSHKNQIVRVWNLQAREIAFTLGASFNSWVRALTFSPRDPLLAVAHEHEIMLFDSRTGEHLRTLHVYADQEYVWSLEFSVDGTFLMCSGGDTTKTISFWNTTTWERDDIAESTSPMGMAGTI